MKTACLLALLLLTPLAAATGEARLSSAERLPASPQRVAFVAKYAAAAAAQASPDSLGARLQAVRTRYAGRRPMSELALAREQRRLQELRPFPAETLGSLGRRTALGERTFAARDDRRLGSQARRELLSRPAALRGDRRGR